MATDNQKKHLEKRLREYRKKYLTRKENLKLDESATRLMVNYFLTDVLGYVELEDIKTEYNIRGEYADYVIQLARKKHFVIEVKAIQLDLNERHLRQSLSYAANEGIDWILLFNGKQIQLYRVIFGKPIAVHKVFDFDLGDLQTIKLASENIVHLCKQNVVKQELTEYWKRFDALTPSNLAKHIYTSEVVGAIRRKLRKATDITFNEDDICKALEELVQHEHAIIRPKVLK
ncbi:hypothetical protein EPN95_01175 [Patescibacteria group bacterium]|nr:MAG: hypothetical protein EPN95_01175 [Patescibacteria group bacterium]